MSRAFATCFLCEANCGIAVEVAEGRVRSVRGDPADPLSRGYICPKAAAIPDLQDDPDRLRRPLRRTGAGGFEEVSWPEALDEAARRLAAVQRAHGRDAVALYLGNPTVHSASALLYLPLLLKALGSKNVYSSNSIDALPRLLVSSWLYGNQALIPIPDVDRTDLLVVLGANPLVSNGSLLTAPGMRRRLQALQARGGRLVVIDPRRTETAAVADAHHFVRPGTDAALLLGLLHVVFDEGLARPGRLAAFARGLDAVAEVARRFPPERTAAWTGVPAEAARRLARDLAAAPSAAIYGRLGTCAQEFGALTTWLIDALHVATGNLDRPGGALFADPAVDLAGLARLLGQTGRFGRWRSRVSGLPEFNGELPVGAFAEEMEAPGPGQVRGLVTHAGNPALSLPNGGRVARALEGLEVMVSIDIYLNETTRHADLILPPTFGLERDHFGLVFQALGARNWTKLSPAVLEPPPGSLHDWEVVLGLATRLLAARGLPTRLGAGLLARAGRRGPRWLLGALLRVSRRGRREGLTLARLLDAPHGLDLGPLEPRLPRALHTRRRRIDLAHPALLADVARVEERLTGPPRPLVLIGRRDLRSNNSWMHNSRRLVKGPERCTLLMHPDDAGARGLEDGARVRVASRTGAVEAPLNVSEEVMPGTVSLPHGWGHAHTEARLRVAAERPGVSVNEVTDDRLLDAVSGCGALNGVPVEVSAAALASAAPT